MRWIPLLALSASLAIIHPLPLSAATIEAAGSMVLGESWEPIGIAWRNPQKWKDFDVDEDGIFGTAGYWLAKTNTDSEKSEADIGDIEQMTVEVPPWLSLTASDPAVNSQFNFGYWAFQNPLNETEKISVGYMGRRYSSTLSVGETYSLFDLTVGKGAPKVFGVTIAFHNEFVGASPSAIQLLQTVGGEAQATFDSLPEYKKNRATFVTFLVKDAKEGDVFSIFGTAASQNTLAINGIMIDSKE